MFLIIFSSVPDRSFFYCLAFLEDSLFAAEVDVIGGNIAQCFMIPPTVVPSNESRDFLLQLIRVFPYLQLDLLFQGTVIPFNLAIGLRVVRRRQDVPYSLLLQV